MCFLGYLPSIQPSPQVSEPMMVHESPIKMAKIHPKKKLVAKVLSLQFVFAPQLHPIPATMALNFVLPSATAPATAVTASPATSARPAATATTSTSSQTATLGAVAAVAGLAMRKRNRSKERNGDLVRRPEENGWIWMDLDGFGEGHGILYIVLIIFLYCIQ